MEIETLFVDAIANASCAKKISNENGQHFGKLVKIVGVALFTAILCLQIPGVGEDGKPNIGRN